MNFRTDSMAGGASPPQAISHEHFPIDAATMRISLTDVARYFGGSGYAVTEKNRPALTAAVETARNLASPKAVFAVYPVDGDAASGEVRLADGVSVTVPCADHAPHIRYLAAAVATLGEGLEDHCRDLSARNRIYDAMLMDAVGTAMLEALDVAVRHRLNERAKALGVFSGKRFSPGLEEYPMDFQPLLLRLSDGTRAGVRLNDAGIMIPVKSVSFFMPFSSVRTESAMAHKCIHCGKGDCQFRTAPSRSTVKEE